MSAPRHDLTIDRAADYGFAVQVQSPLGTSVDMTGAEAYADIVDAGGLQIVAATCAAADGVVTMSLSRSQSLSLVAGEAYSYDLFLLRDSVSLRLLYGTVTVTQNKTKGIPIDPLT